MTWAALFPDDIGTLAAHEPPSAWLLPDADAAERAFAAIHATYHAGGRNRGMAQFIAMTGWQGEYTDEYFARPSADPAMFGMPAEDDGSRDDPLLSERSATVLTYRYDLDAISRARRVVVARAAAQRTGVAPLSASCPSIRTDIRSTQVRW